MDTLKTIQDLKEMSGFNRTFIYKQIKIGNLAKPLKVGRSSRWKESDVKAWLEILSNGSRGCIDVSNAINASLASRKNRKNS